MIFYKYYLFFFLLYTVVLFLIKKVTEKKCKESGASYEINSFSVLELSALLNNKITHKDIAASIFELAAKGYIKIFSNAKNKNKSEVNLVKIDENLSEGEKLILQYLFGKSLKLNGKKVKFTEVSGILTRKKIMSVVFADLKRKGYLNHCLTRGKIALYGLFGWAVLNLICLALDFISGGVVSVFFFDNDLNDLYVFVYCFIALYFYMKFVSRDIARRTTDGQCLKEALFDFRKELAQKYKDGEENTDEEYFRSIFAKAYVFGDSAYVEGIFRNIPLNTFDWYESDAKLTLNGLFQEMDSVFKDREEQDNDFASSDRFAVSMGILFLVLMLVDKITGF